MTIWNLFDAGRFWLARDGQVRFRGVVAASTSLLRWKRRVHYRLVPIFPFLSIVTRSKEWDFPSGFSPSHRAGSSDRYPKRKRGRIAQDSGSISVPESNRLSIGQK